MRAPLHLWVVGIALLVWNGIGALDYLMTELRVDSYLAAFTPEQRAYFEGFPAWVVAAWAIAVWAGVLGAILLLLRRRSAVGVFALSFIAMLVTAVHNFILSAPRLSDLVGPGALAFSAVIVVLGVAQWEYARRMARSGVLS